MCDPIPVTQLKVRPHYSQSSHKNATPSSGTSPLASYIEDPPPPHGGCTLKYACFALLTKQSFLLCKLICIKKRLEII